MIANRVREFLGLRAYQDGENVMTRTDHTHNPQVSAALAALLTGPVEIALYAGSELVMCEHALLRSAVHHSRYRGEHDGLRRDYCGGAGRRR